MNQRIQRLFYLWVCLAIGVILYVEMLADVTYFWYGIVLPLVSLFIIYLIFTRDKTAKEELITFFIFPIFMSFVLQGIFYFILGDSQTTSILSGLIFIPVANIGYTVYSLKRKEVNYKQLSHMVTSIQAMLFVSTLIGFLVKNPLLFDGYFLKTKIETLGITGTQISQLSLSSLIEALTQTIFLPYLFSATAIKGWIEYRNFVIEYKK